jgi:hypothetical protein
LVSRSGSTPTLDSGVVSASVRRKTALAIALLAVVWRLVPVLRVLRTAPDELRVAMEAAVPVPFTLQDFGLGAFLVRPEVAWVGSPLYLLGVALDSSLHGGGVLVLVLQWLLGSLLAAATFHVGERWIGYRGAVLAGLLCALSRQSLMACMAIVPAVAISLGCLLFASMLSRLHARSTGQHALRLGLGSGALSLLSGLGVLWTAVALVWMAMRARAFRGWRLAVGAGYLLAGHLAVLSPVLLHNALTQRDLVAPCANAPFELYLGAASRGLASREGLANVSDLLARRQYGLLLLERLEPGRTRRELGRGCAWLRLAAGELARHPGSALTSYLRRAVAYLGGPLPVPPSAWLPASVWKPSQLPMVPIGAILALSWLGCVALAGSVRAYVPLFGGLLLPWVTAVLAGASLTAQIVALPFLCLMAGYGIARVWEGRRWPVTWLMALPVLAAGVVVVLLF